MDKDYIVVMDFCSGNIYYDEFPEHTNPEDFISKHSLNIDECSYMITVGVPSFINIKTLQNETN